MNIIEMTKQAIENPGVKFKRKGCDDSQFVFCPIKYCGDLYTKDYKLAHFNTAFLTADDWIMMEE